MPFGSCFAAGDVTQCCGVKHVGAHHDFFLAEGFRGGTANGSTMASSFRREHPSPFPSARLRLDFTVARMHRERTVVICTERGMLSYVFLTVA